MIIDSFSHFFPREYLHELRRSAKSLQFIGPDEKTGRLYITDGLSSEGIAYVRIGSGFDNLEIRLKEMDRYAIDMQAISVGHPGIDSGAMHVAPEVAVKLARIINDSIARIADEHPDRLIPIAEIPILEMDAALDELSRAVKDLGMKGVQLYSTLDGKTLDNRQFRPFFEKAAHLDVPVFIHPTYPPATQRRSYEGDYELQMIYVWPFETTLAVSRLAFSGILEEFPNLKLVTHHAGAMIPFFSERITNIFRQARKGGLRDQAKMKREPMDYFKMMYHDTAMYGNVAALDCAARILGASRMIYATDYPFGPEDGTHYLRVTHESVEQMKVSPEEREEIYSGNARRIFKI